MQEILVWLSNLRRNIKSEQLKISSVLLGIGILLGFALGFIVVRGGYSHPSDDISVSSVDFLDSEESYASDNNCDVQVEVVGEINDPGVLCLDAGSIVKDAIEGAGGFSDEVCLGWIIRNINQASIVETNTKIFIPGKDDEECKVPLSDEGKSDSTSAGGLISINEATKEDLISISGVGPATAEKIIEGRPYKALEDIKRVKGIGDSTYEAIKDSICL